MYSPPKFNITTLNGTNGFIFIDDLGNGAFGASIAKLGDVNKDGKSDFIALAGSNQAYVLFGADRFPSRLYTSSLNGTNGFKIIGESESEVLGCAASGISDVNGDGIDDFSIVSCNPRIPIAYVIFGSESFSPRFSVSTINGKNGFKVTGYINQGFAEVDGIGDVNNDGRQDFIISNYYTSMDSRAAFAIYGASEFPAKLNVSSLDGLIGFTIVGTFATQFGVSVAGIGDFNGDTKSDFIAGSDYLNQAYVIFGTNRFSSVMHTSNLNGTNGFKIIGPIGSGCGYPVAGIGDINGDGLPDLGVGAHDTDEAFLVFGARHFNSTFDVSSIDGSNGVKLIGGPSLISAFGFAMAGTGPINNVKSGVIIGAPQTGTHADTGSAFVFFGARHFPPEIHASSLNGTSGFEVVGLPGHQLLGWSVAGIDNLIGNGQSSLAVGAPLEGVVYVILDASIMA